MTSKGIAHFRLPPQRAQFDKTGPCVDVPVSVMYPVRKRDEGPALALCARCDVRDECLTHALANKERFGVWGGTTERQRRAMVAARRKVAA